MPRIIALTATVENMERVEGTPGVFAYDRCTGDRYSATPGDYLFGPHDRPLLDDNNAPLILARAETRIVPVLP